MRVNEIATCSAPKCERISFASVSSNDEIDLPHLCVSHWCELVDSVSFVRARLIEQYGIERVTNTRMEQVERVLTDVYCECGGRIKDGVFAWHARMMQRNDARRVGATYVRELIDG